jgi:hypothetical protein
MLVVLDTVALTDMWKLRVHLGSLLTIRNVPICTTVGTCLFGDPAGLQIAEILKT